MNIKIIPALTGESDNDIMTLPLTHSRDRIETLKKGGKTPLSIVVFLCPLKSNTEHIRMLPFMVGCIEQPLKRLAAAFRGSLNLIQSTAQDLRLKSGGLNSRKELSHE